MINKLNYPILSLKFTEAFEQLSNDEKLYAHYFQKACYEGAPIILFQISYESPAMFIILQTFFSSFQPFDEIKKQVFLKSKYSFINLVG
jgi:dipeptidyl-peptidase-3